MKSNFSILVTSHETLCEGYLAAAALILGGNMEGIVAIPFTDNMGLTDYNRKIELFIEENTSNSLLILTDLLGGTPNNVSVSFLSNADVQLITGINLPLFLEVLLVRESGLKLKTIDFSSIVINAQKSIVHVNPILNGGSDND